MLKPSEEVAVMEGNTYVIGVYAAYAAIAVGLTAWLARTLSRNGAIFLADVFKDRAGLAEAVNRLLVVGFYMLNLGYAFYILRADSGLDAFGSIQFLVNRLALLLVTLALIHFVNVLVFWKIRGRTEQRQLPVPVAPQAIVAPSGRGGK
ncbi:MAG: hypothetical protein ABR548_06990 [Actinomycetota bacterium]|nr:hypothetical protein [Actinomycetota bacterium]